MANISLFAEFKKKTIMNTVLTVVFIVLPIVLAVLFVASIISNKNISDGVYIGDLYDGSYISVNVGGLDKDSAIRLVKEKFTGSEFKGKTITVTAGGREQVIDLEKINTRHDAEKAVSTALAYANSGNVFDDIKATIKSKIIKTEIPIDITVDIMKLDSELIKLNDGLDSAMKPHTHELVGDKILLKAGVSGLGVNLLEARKIILDNINSNSFGNINVYYETVQPLPLTEDYIEKEYLRKAKDAEIYTKDGKMEIMPEVIGVSFSIDALSKALDIVNVEGKNAEIPVVLTKPSISRGDITKTLFADVLGSFTSSFNEGLVERSTNVKMATRRINGTVFAPGETFSYNAVVGPRNEARGFKYANIYQNNKVVSGMGGGICQVTSTLYCAVLYADLEVITRYNHSLTVNYVPLGQDATVVDGVIDFVFKNNTKYPIKIVASASGGKNKITIYGYNENKSKTVKLENVTIKTVPYPSTSEVLPTLADGQTKIDTKGSNGYVVDTYKLIYENGVLISKRKLHTSKYNPITEVKFIGGGISTEPNNGGTNNAGITGNANGGDIQILPVISPSPMPVTSPTPTTSPNPENPIVEPETVIIP